MRHAGSFMADTIAIFRVTVRQNLLFTGGRGRGPTAGQISSWRVSTFLAKVTAMRAVHVILLLLLPAVAQAHPHLFIETAVAVLFNERGEATGIRVTWGYDKYTTLQYLADHGMDQDMEGKLTDKELSDLNGFDMHWAAGYAGDTYAKLDDTPLNLSQPRDWTLTYADGQISTKHIRDFDVPIALGRDVLKLQTYDPTYYVDYEMSPVVEFVGAPPGRRCQAIFRAADKAKAKKDLEAAIRALSNDPESNFPAMGKQFAGEAWVICASHS